MTALIERADKHRIRQLIFETKGGRLTDSEITLLDEYLTFSERLYVGSIHGELCCAWGLVPPSLLSDRAYLWLFSTDAVEEYKFLFVRHSQRAVDEMLENWPVITGYCEIANPRSVRWLRWLGATFKEPVKGFIPFEIRKDSWTRSR